jgi:hypothetical protein
MSRQQHQQRQQQFVLQVWWARSGCQARMELKHGSNVSGWKQALWCGVADSVMPFLHLQVAALQTEAVLDVLTDEWVVNTRHTLC